LPLLLHLISTENWKRETSNRFLSSRPERRDLALDFVTLSAASLVILSAAKDPYSSASERMCRVFAFDSVSKRETRNAKPPLKPHLEIRPLLNVNAVHEPYFARVASHDQRLCSCSFAEEPHSAQQRSIGHARRRKDDVLARCEVF
jgi:hypothetical protein